MSTRKPDAIDIEVGQRIRIARLAAGLSQTDLGQRVGVTFQQVQKYEKGTNRVGAGRLTQIARVLSVPVNSFFEGREVIENVARQGVESPLSLLTHPHAFRLLQAFNKLDDGEVRRAIVELVERLAEKPAAAGANGGRGARRH
jgi:transcriptional regulator with XRE-family HTH domain